MKIPTPIPKRSKIPTPILKRYGFTLVELLVVIAIIALLVSILMPALSGARDKAKSVYCMATLMRNAGLANHIYADEWDDWFVPIVNGPFNMWYQNDEFEANMSLQGEEVYGELFQKTFQCPSADSKTAANNEQGNQYTIAPNRTGTVKKIDSSATGSGDGEEGVFVGTRRGKVPSAGNKMMYTDATGYYFVHVLSANYETVWNLWGDVNGDYSWNWSAPSYRHSEGANILFFDGHVGNMKKEYIYDVFIPESNTFLWDIGQK